MGIKLILFVLLSMLPLVLMSETPLQQNPSPGIIIILNGPSASGKSSIQNELQKQFSSLYLKVGIDTFFDALIANPDLSNFEQTKEFSQYTNDGILIRGVRLGNDAEGMPVVPLKIGPAGDKIISGMHAAIAAYAKRGNNLIVDYILYKPEWRMDLLEALKDNKVYFIGVKAPLSVLEERERKRGTSPVGHARSHYATVHHAMTYDLELDVSSKTPAEAAAQIKQFVESHPHPQALKTMLDKRI